MQGAQGGRTSLDDAESRQVSTLAFIFRNILCKSPLVVLIELHHCVQSNQYKLTLSFGQSVFNQHGFVEKIGKPFSKPHLKEYICNLVRFL